MSHPILAAILALMPAPSPKWDETQEAYTRRMTMTAESTERAVMAFKPGIRKSLAYAVIVTFWGESRFSPLIHSGEHRGDGGQAICMGSNHQLELSTEEWEGLAGITPEATERCAALTARRLVMAWHYCFQLDPKAGYLEAFTLYGTGRTCRPQESKWKNIFLDRGRKWAALVATGKGR